MSDVYADDIETVIELLTEFGAPVVIDVLRDGVTNGATPWLVELPDPVDPDEPDPATFTAIAVIVGKAGAARDVTYQAKAYLRPDDASNLVTNDCRITDAGGNIWKVVNADLLSPDAVSRIIYTCELNKWSQL